MDKRVCIKCEIEYPLQDKYFALVNKKGTRRVTVCRECRKEYDRQYREDKKEQELGNDMYTIKEESLESKTHRMRKAFGYLHMRAFGEPMTEQIYWCKKCDCVQITTDECGSCNKTMENIGFIDYHEDK